MREKMVVGSMLLVRFVSGVRQLCPTFVLLSAFLAGLFLSATASAAQMSSDEKGEEQASSSDSVEAGPTLEQILNQDPQKEDYVEERNCLSVHRIRTVKVLDDQHVVFETRRGKRYLVQFKHRCFGLKANRPISYEVNSSQVCKFDSIRGLENFGGRLQPGQRCQIPGFQSISEEQVVSLKENLKSAKQRAHEERKARREAEHKARKAKRKV